MTVIEPKILLITADAASISDGKINMLGAGWTRISAGLANFCVVVRLDIPWNMTNSELDWSLDLTDQDGRIYEPTETSGRLHLEGQVQVGRPDNLQQGASLEAPLVIPFIQLPLRPGPLEWRFQVAQTVAKYPFSVV
jgi:hypothetical protein